MYFSWAAGGNEQWFYPRHYRCRFYFFFFFFLQGNISATTSCDRYEIRRIEASAFSCFNTSRAAWRGGQGSRYPHFSCMKALSFSIYRTATAPWNKTFFFFKWKKDMILSLIFLYLFEPVIENRATRRLRAVGLECWRGKTYTQSREALTHQI